MVQLTCGTVTLDLHMNKLTTFTTRYKLFYSTLRQSFWTLKFWFLNYYSHYIPGKASICQTMVLNLFVSIYHIMQFNHPSAQCSLQVQLLNDLNAVQSSKKVKDLPGTRPLCYSKRWRLLAYIRQIQTFLKSLEKNMLVSPRLWE